MRCALALALVCVASGTAFAAPRVTTESTRAILGETEELVLHVDADGELSAAVSSGTLEEIARDGDAHTFRWTPPDLRFPTTAVFAFWESAASSPDVAVFTVPLLGRTTLEMDTEPFADVRVQVGGESFGPEKANAKGRVKVPIAVPPGVRTAQVIATAKGQQTSRSVPLEVPKTEPYAVAVGPDPLPPSGGWVAVVMANGASGSSVKLEASGARLSDAGAASSRATWRITPTGGPGSEVTLNVSGAETRRVTVTVGKRMGGEPVASGPALPVVPALLAGAFIGGGANAGFLAELGASAHPAPFPRWLSLGASVGLRTAGFSANPDGLGSARSSLLAVPISVGARARVFERGPFAVDARAGVGALPFRHSYSAPFQQSFVETGVGFEAAAGAELLYRVGPVELALDVRGAFTQARTAHVMARPGGLLLSVGARYLGR